MFSLCHGFWKLLFRQADFHIIILGIDAAGKTSCLESPTGSFQSSSVSHSRPTPYQSPRCVRPFGHVSAAVHSPRSPLRHMRGQQ